jgi:DNA-binding transcriptional regulator YiaG
MPSDSPSHQREGAAPQPLWSAVLRTLREARAVTQAGWAAQLGVGRRTVQRWEQGRRRRTRSAKPPSSPTARRRAVPVL